MYITSLTVYPSVLQPQTQYKQHKLAGLQALSHRGAAAAMKCPDILKSRCPLQLTLP